MSADLETELADRFDPREGGAGARRALRGLAGVAAFVLVWAVAARFNPDYVLPGPLATGETFLTEVRSGRALDALASSVQHWLLGTVVGTTLGVGLGVLLGWSDAAEDGAAPLVRLLRPVPPLALTGFGIAWFGINHVGAAFIVAAGAFWINYYAAYGGVRSVSDDLLDVARSLGVRSDLGLIRKVVLPSASPEILTGVRTGVGRCWMLIIAAETIGVAGVGNRILTAASNLAVDVVIAYILVMSLVYLVLDTLFQAAEDRILGWRA
ncbi:ABC transporter permease [Halobaculum gomorrense]|uniref:NitT/TauT family transport system permease protein n=1 Tax=Halobaculum gomorrense TaxID=43928 RepID=A0A1M5RHQ3_9EURY|nr:ABC transporter permease [Halobaculum gomorrense]SHH25862.1 NitT/TauT family transport system permease protein [Halobaculum gomorrense]